MMNSKTYCVVLFPGMLRCSGRRVRLQRRAGEPAGGLMQSGCMGPERADGGGASLLLLRRQPACPQLPRRLPPATNRA